MAQAEKSLTWKVSWDTTYLEIAFKDESIERIIVLLKRFSDIKGDPPLI